MPYSRYDANQSENNIMIIVACPLGKLATSLSKNSFFDIKSLYSWVTEFFILKPPHFFSIIIS